MIKNSQLVFYVSVLCLLLGVLMVVQRHTIDQQSIDIATYNDMKNEQQSFVVYVKKNSCPDCQLFDKKLNGYTYLSFSSSRKVVYVLDLEQESNSKLVADFIEENQLKEVPSVLKVSESDSQLEDIQSIF
ncbi:hypothetical protein [Enterococcus gallinarum]|uniref:hypothetical protein n=1 Tax=Enterococcus gallinarum TaxID=1353 RepID=UPI001072F50A|nr:hypothetical protein [Enterococcus gallinarum]MBF0825564.1 hypothetical protein [Enterococcus faecalis]MBF0726224.1 hypothetical protein [Enterococcus gallinarum]MBF0799133.1 hypothetical protein [Enterococcus gallinarum]NYS82325.1 hypothetical protein [Enterococcus gallinarum]TFV13917.1 hypothetical protein E4T76_16820 [Enterococcus gallinarum]